MMVLLSCSVCTIQSPDIFFPCRVLTFSTTLASAIPSPLLSPSPLLPSLLPYCLSASSLSLSVCLFWLPLCLSSDLFKSLQSGSQAALPPHLQLAFSGKLCSSSSSSSLALLPPLSLPLSVCCLVGPVALSAACPAPCLVTVDHLCYFFLLFAH